VPSSNYTCPIKMAVSNLSLRPEEHRSALHATLISSSLTTSALTIIIGVLATAPLSMPPPWDLPIYFAIVIGLVISSQWLLSVLTGDQYLVRTTSFR